MKRFVLGEFEEPYACVDAVRRLRESGVGGLDSVLAASPARQSRCAAPPPQQVPLVALTGGLLGAIGGYACSGT